MEQKSHSVKELVRLDNFPKAAELIDAVLSQKYNVVIYGGAIRGGKTYNSIAALILLHRMFPSSRSMIVRDTLDTLRKNTLPTCDKAIPSNFIKHFKGDPQFEWTFKNKAKMFFFAEGYEKDKEYMRWNGLEVNFILLEQIEELQIMALEKSLERIGSYVIQDEKQPNPLLLMTVNPNKGWAKELIYDKYVAGTLPKGWLYIPALLTDNPTIPQGFKDSLQQLKAINPIKYQRFVEGDWEVQEIVEGAFYKKFNYEKTVGQHSYNKELPLHITFDFNVNPYVTLLVLQIEVIEDDDEDVKDKKNVYQIDEICLENPDNTTKAACKEFERKYYNHSEGLIVYGDPSGKHQDTRSEQGYNDYDIIRQALSRFKPSFRIGSAAPPVIPRGNFINTIFEQGFEGIEIFIDEDCKLTIKDFSHLQEDINGKKKKRKITNPKTKVTYEEYGHCSDGFDYFLCEAFNAEFNNYQRGPVSDNPYTLHKRRKSGSF